MKEIKFVKISDTMVMRIDNIAGVEVFSENHADSVSEMSNPDLKVFSGINFIEIVYKDGKTRTINYSDSNAEYMMDLYNKIAKALTDYQLKEIRTTYITYNGTSIIENENANTN
jgi:hypothetical protein